jgi:hypothetical protein
VNSVKQCSTLQYMMAEEYVRLTTREIRNRYRLLKVKRLRTTEEDWMILGWIIEVLRDVTSCHLVNSEHSTQRDIPENLNI